MASSLRTIRSFVRREGRITPAQRSAIARLSTQYCLSSISALRDLDRCYQRYAPRTLEIGCGSGEVILSLATANPASDYLGIEVYQPGLGQVLNGLERGALHNVRMLHEDAVEALAHVPDGSFAAVCIFFPDPWPKKRHHKRRLIQPAFVADLQRVLKSHGRFFIATDWQDYADHISSVVNTKAGFFNLAGSNRRSPRPRWRTQTRYEQRAVKEKREVFDFAFGKR